MSTLERWTYPGTYLKPFLGRRDRDRMVVGLTTACTCAISAYNN